MPQKSLLQQLFSVCFLLLHVLCSIACVSSGVSAAERAESSRPPRAKDELISSLPVVEQPIVRRNPMKTTPRQTKTAAAVVAQKFPAPALRAIQEPKLAAPGASPTLPSVKLEAVKAEPLPELVVSSEVPPPALSSASSSQPIAQIETVKAEPLQEPNVSPVSAPPTVLSTTPPTESLHSSDSNVKKAPALQGSMRIAFETRTNLDSNRKPKPGALDSYFLDLTLIGSYSVKGKITRRPQILSSILRRETQSPELSFELEFAAKGSEKKFLMKGKVPYIDGERFDFTSGSLKVVGVEALNSQFLGRIIGKKKADSGLGSKFAEYTRIFGKKKLTYRVSHVDPLTFKDLRLGSFGVSDLPAAVVNGHLDFDYDTGNWLTNELSIRFSQDEKWRDDKVSGSIRWTEDPARESNGKGNYEFNLRFNENHSDESSYFTEATDESDFFAASDDIPGISGTVRYRDSFGPKPEGDEAAPVVSSVIDYDLFSTGLEPAQVANFLRVWLLIVGPVNDE